MLIVLQGRNLRVQVTATENFDQLSLIITAIVNIDARVPRSCYQQLLVLYVDHFLNLMIILWGVDSSLDQRLHQTVFGDLIRD